MRFGELIGGRGVYHHAEVRPVITPLGIHLLTLSTRGLRNRTSSENLRRAPRSHSVRGARDDRPAPRLQAHATRAPADVNNDRASLINAQPRRSPR